MTRGTEGNRMSFQSPVEFVEYLKFVRNEVEIFEDQYEAFQKEDSIARIAGKSRLKFFNRKEQQILNKPDTLLIRNKYDLHATLIDKHVRNYLLKLPTQYSEAIQNHIAFGTIITNDFNAACLKSDDKKVAILINSGLVRLLNSTIKYMLAGISPDKVLHWKGDGPKPETREEWIEIMHQYIENYTKNKFSGPFITLDHPLSLIQGGTCVISELFVLCHELGHFFNGDLDNDENLVQFLYFNDVAILEEGKSHQMEYNADIKGFELLLQIISITNVIPLSAVLSYISYFFDILHLISEHASSSHPAPRDRLINLAKHYYGEEVALKLLRSHQDLNFNIGSELKSIVPICMKSSF